MNQSVSKFLEFNGRTLVFLAVDGQYWIALKPVCEAINVEYTRAFKNAKADSILGQLLAEQPMVGADGKTRKMISLPEKYVYGWLMSIQSGSEDLLDYKRLCYEVLFDHFHGSITNRQQLLAAKAQAKAELNAVFNSLSPDMAIRYQKNKDIINRVNAALRIADQQVIDKELTLFTS